MDVRKGTWSTKEIEVINDLQLLTAKPVIYLVNLSERDYVRKKNKWLPKMKAWIDEHNPGDLLIPFSVALEERHVPLSDEEQNAELETLGLEVAKAKGLTPGLGKMSALASRPPATVDSTLTPILAAPQHDRRICRPQPYPLLHLRPAGGSGLDRPEGHQGPRRGRRHPLGL
jgi:hypothetical protein